ncbi:acetolactate synthase small subunit [Draconibacterium mangrovi]|uniref:acetolactate synthase small subunit n=1 Tax=Draconibacterium mangrovi TaxID=2697469 RepID=UPI0013D88E3E|nr:acetolactate synthase small subunit [Draconibacterium mangrovi]
MKKEYILTVYSENHIGLLTRITNVFTRRKTNIDSLTVSESALHGIFKFTIVIHCTDAMAIKLVSQIEKQIDVLKAFYHTNDEMIFQEIALYKVPIEPIYESDTIEKIVRKAGARILEITKDYVVIEKTGHKEDTQALFEELNQFKVMQFIRSGRVAITRDPIERLSEFLKERDAFLTSLD